MSKLSLDIETLSPMAMDLFPGVEVTVGHTSGARIA